MKRFAAAALLLLLSACQPLPELPGASTPYAQTVAGLTLVYTDPELKPAEQMEQRLQVRVNHVAQDKDGSLLVRKELTRGLGKPLVISVRVAQGGVALADDQGKPQLQLLPEGFPDRVSSWEEHGTKYSVIGRAAWGGAAILPRDTDPVGVWVEARPARGLRSRSLYLKGYGEVETLEERPGGSWVCVNRLQQQGFESTPTLESAPSLPTEAKPKSKPVRPR